MADSWIPFCLLISSAFLLAPFKFTNGQLVPTESTTLFQIQELLEYPQALQAWNNWTNFCFLPPTPSLTIVCSGNHITQLTIVGNRSSPSHITPKMSASNFAVSQHTLSHRFSTDSFFTILTKLSSLQKLSLVSLGLWGTLPAKVSWFRSLEVLNISSNFIFGELPHSVSSYQSLRSLVLSGNLFNGSVPDLTNLSSLEELHLSNNYFGPSFPSLNKNLVHIDLASNSLRSKIPQDLKKFNKLRFLDVSSTKLVGTIPSFLFTLPSVEHISLAKNQLSGAFPTNASCSANLNFVDVSNNLLIGRLPSCLASKVGNKSVVIMWNCLTNTTSKYQRPSALCQKEALAVMPTVGNQEEKEKEKEKESPLKLGIVLGIVGSVVAIFGVLGLLILVLYRRMQRKNGSIYRSESFVMEKTSVRGSPIGRHVPQPIRLTSLSLPPYHVFTLEDMQYATNSFDPSNLVVEGDQGQLYKGWLRDGSAVLVKCLKLRQKHSTQALQQHMEVISKLRHRHLASVLGHCIVSNQDHPGSASALFIVVENIGNGSLRDHLIDWRKRQVLKWPQRVAIAMGVARGVQYLHTSGVVGNDIKIGNILLDHSLTAKISSYNINIPSKVGAEDASNHHSHGEKEDIYRLGVILVEVITGRPMHTTSEVDDLKFQLERSLAESATMLRDVMDPSMRGTFAYESMKTVVQISINCLSKDPRGRPTVEDVLWHMQYAVQVQEGWTNSGNLSGNKL